MYVVIIIMEQINNRYPQQSLRLLLYIMYENKYRNILKLPRICKLCNLQLTKYNFLIRIA